MTTSPAQDERPLLLEMRGISKAFPGVLALSDVSLTVRRGEVVSLVGENGAGKSTLMKILSGVYEKDAGEIYFRGELVEFTTPRQAQDAGIATIYQELNQVPQLSVTENVFLGNEITHNGLIDWKEMHRQARELLMRLHLDIDPKRRLDTLGVGQQQMVEVAKALHHKADLIIMDEPTSSLSIREIKDLFEIVLTLKAQDVAIIYISHHLNEVFEVSDRVNVLRDGRLVSTLDVEELNEEKLIKLMVGRDLTEQYPKEQAPRAGEMLRVEGLNIAGEFEDISFTAYGGEVLGISGLVGAGRTELARAIFGVVPIDSGRFFIEGQEVTIKNPRAAIRHGIAFLTEDRKQQGLFLQLPLRENITISILASLTRLLRIDRQKETALSRAFIKEIDIRTSGPEQIVRDMSGGNQQKVILSRWVATEPKILIFDEPTRGIDVQAKVEIYRLMNRLAAQGVAILMISSELPEILGMSDRIMVISQGRVTGILDREEATEEKIMEFATKGSKSRNGKEQLA